MAADHLSQRMCELLAGDPTDPSGHLLVVNDELLALRQSGLELASTIVALVLSANPNGSPHIECIRVGDSDLWQLNPDGTWIDLFAEGQLAQVPTEAFATSRVNALPALDLQAVRVLSHDPADGAVIIAMSDGVSVPLRGGSEVRDTLSSWWGEPPSAMDFARQVDFARKSHVDDRTAVAVWLPSNGGTRPTPR